MHKFFEQIIASIICGDEKASLIPAKIAVSGKSKDGAAILTQDICGGLQAVLEYDEPCEGAVTYQFSLKNTGIKNTPRITEVKSLDLTLNRREGEPIVYESLAGDSCGAASFMPVRLELSAEDSCRIAPVGGRSSDTTGFPYFDITHEDLSVIFAIGWSGQWEREIKVYGDSYNITAGISEVDFYLEPGEEIRLPSILMMTDYSGKDALRRRFRKLMLERYSPQARLGESMKLPISLQPYDRYFYGRCPEWPTEAGQIRSIGEAVKCKYLDNIWLDAAWFREGFPNGVGNYEFAEGFPNGLKPVSDAAHKNGMKFMLWFEPERIHANSDTAKQHPEFLLSYGGNAQHEWQRSNFLINLADDAARDWLDSVFTKFIAENGLDILRIDFNIEPLSYWQNNDAEGRRGITQIKYINNLYKLWDSLLDKFPNLMIDNCASGGRRIDFETCKRSVPLWRSDTGCSPASEKHRTYTWNQNQCLCLTQYIAFHACASWEPVPYDMRAAQSGGLACTFDVLNPEFDFAKAERVLEEVKRLRPYWKGDFYPLAEPSVSETEWSAYQLALPEGGACYIFRRDECADTDYCVKLEGLDAGSSYAVTLTDENMTAVRFNKQGSELMSGYPVNIAEPHGSIILEYKLL